MSNDTCQPDAVDRITRIKDRLAAIREKLQQVVVTDGEDAGVVLLSQEGPTHTEEHGGRTVVVYDHEYFSPLGDALMALWKLTDIDAR